MTDSVEEKQSDEIVTERIRFACNSLGMSEADADEMAQRAIASRAKADIKTDPKS
jgi:hypothetical protein